MGGECCQNSEGGSAIGHGQVVCACTSSSRKDERNGDPARITAVLFQRSNGWLNVVHNEE